MKKTRVLHILPDLMPYGLEKMVASLVLLADRDRFEPAVVSLYGRQEGSLAKQIEDAGVQVFHLDKRRGLDLRMFPRLREVCGQFQPDVLHTHNYVLRYTLPVAALTRPGAQVHTIHNVADQEVDRLGMWLQNKAFHSGAVVPVAIAGEVAASMERVYGIRNPELIPNGIPVRAFADVPGQREAWRAKEGYAQDELLIACVARFFPQKNHHTLLIAFSQLQNTNAKLLLAGDGYLESEVRAQAEQLGIEDRVKFIGRRDDVAALLASVDMVALASLWEGNPLSVMEAMAAGRACAMTSVGAIPELMEHGRSGLIAPPGNAKALAEAMQTLLDNPELRGRMGVAARQRALQKFDHQVMVDSYQDLYLRALQGRKQAVAA
ncbi:glycosyl transferase [Bryobacterales bacterium F-183]|nr:glycosyl transferase [Bryobacterales bacterium F-183]